MDKITYTTTDGQETRYQGRNGRQALRVAKQIPGATVDMHVVSGTYRSDTRIYPAIGTTYSR